MISSQDKTVYCGECGCKRLAPKNTQLISVPTIMASLTYFLNMLRNVFSFEESSGAFSAPGALGGTVSVDIVDGAVEGAGEGR